MPSLKKQTCPTCGQSVNEREISLFKGMVYTLWDVLMWCENRNNYEFTRKEVKPIILKRGENIVARFGDWVFFGGLVYKPDGKKGHYGINAKRVKDFFVGDYQIPTTIIKNPLSKEIRKENYCYITEIPQLKEFLDENGEYIASYRDPKQEILI